MKASLKPESQESSDQQQPPTQSPATAAAEQLDKLFFQEWISKTPHASKESIASIIQSAYSSTEQELREARRLLGCVKSTFEFIHDECDWNGLDRQGTGGGDDRIGPSCANAIDDLSAFLSKNSNLPRE